MLSKLLIVYPIIFYASNFKNPNDYQAVVTAATVVNRFAQADIIWTCYEGHFPATDPIALDNGFFEIGPVPENPFIDYFKKLLSRANQMAKYDPEKKYQAIALNGKNDRDILVNWTRWRPMSFGSRVWVIAHEMLHTLGWSHNDYFPNLMSSSLNTYFHLDDDELAKWRKLIIEMTDEKVFEQKMREAHNITSQKECRHSYHHPVKKAQVRFYWN